MTEHTNWRWGFLLTVSVALISGLAWLICDIAFGTAPLGAGLIACSATGFVLVAWQVFTQRARLRAKQRIETQNSAGNRQEIQSLIHGMIQEHRYALLLRPQIAAELSPEHFSAARKHLEAAAALVPGGLVEQGIRALASDIDGAPLRLIHVPSYWIDRDPITNEQYRLFVAAGGYAQQALWEAEAWPLAARMVDRDGQPGPAFWHAGEFAAGTQQQPVVGVSWYEALAYSRWAGKRLPTDPQWLKAAGWPIPAGQGRVTQRRYPWGESFEAQRANLRGSGSDRVVAVQEFAPGASANGVRQLLGNIWEWTTDEFETHAHAPLTREHPAASLKILRGGAYDTDATAQAASDLFAGESPLARRADVGFRCVLWWNDILPANVLLVPPVAVTPGWLTAEQAVQARIRQEIVAQRNAVPLRSGGAAWESDFHDKSFDCVQASGRDSAAHYRA